MKYSETELFAFMDKSEEGKQVKVMCTNGQVVIGHCWAYGVVQNEEENGVAEPSLDVGPGVSLYVSEIESVEVLP